MSVMLYERPFFVHTFDVDVKDCLRPASILDFFQDVASIHAEKLGVGFDDLVNMELYWIILYEEFEIYDDYVPFGTELMTRTWPKSRTRLEFEREYELRSMDGRLVAKGISTWCVINTETRKLERADKVVFNGEYYTETNYPEKINRKMKLDFDTPDLVMDYKVQYSDLDHNQHMNNAKYLDIIYNMHVTEKRMKKCRISFVHEAKVGQIIHVEYKKTEEGDCYIGKLENDICFMAIAIMEE